MLCDKGHRFWAVLEDLPDSQAGAGRHKCTGCAYERGYDDARAGRGRHLVASSLPDSQAGTGRHKDVQAAYDLGYDRAQRALPKH